MGQRIDDEIREQELKEKAKRAALIEKILTPEGIAELDEIMEERQLAEKNAELNAARCEKFENEIKEKLSLWLADINEPIWKQIEKLQERIASLEALVKGHPARDARNHPEIMKED